MSNEVTTTSAEFRIQRVSKAGKITSRDLNGVLMSGTVKERESAVVDNMLRQWENGTFHSVVDNLYRVFGAKAVNQLQEQMNERIRGRNEVAPVEKHEAVIHLMNSPTKKAVLYVVQALILQSPDLKGEKLKLLNVLRGVVAAETARMLANQAKAEAAAQLALTAAAESSAEAVSV